MEGVKMNVKTLAAYMDMTVAELETAAGIKKYHLESVSAKRATMTGDDVVALSRTTGIPVANIETSKDKQ